MIRRGLQLVVGLGIFMMLGAALCFGQVGSTNFPTKITLQGFSVAGVNGLYVVIAGPHASNSGGRFIAARYETSLTPPSYWLSLEDDTTGSGETKLRVWNQYPTDPFNANTSQMFYKFFPGTSFPSSVSGFINAPGYTYTANSAAIFDWGLPPDPYERAFPDWESAGVKIPLGFSFAMSFWAVCIVATIGIKWAKELASAAS